MPGCPQGRGRNAWLAKRLGVTYEAVRKYFAGEVMPTAARLPGIAAAMGVTPAYLRGETRDAVLTELESILQGIPDQTVRQEIVAFARFKLGGLKPSPPAPDSTQASR